MIALIPIPPPVVDPDGQLTGWAPWVILGISAVAVLIAAAVVIGSFRR